MLLSVSNFGIFGSGPWTYRDCETGQPAPSCEYPQGSQQNYLKIGAVWVGAVVGSDTLVSAGIHGSLYEFLPCTDQTCGIEKRSSLRQSPHYSEDFVSDLDMIAVYSDTVTHPELPRRDWLGRPHTPLCVEITQRSYSWSADYAGDFVLVDYDIKNVGEHNLERVQLGVYIIEEVAHWLSYPHEMGSDPLIYDDLCGFVETHPSRIGRGYVDTVDLAWWADNDGDPGESGVYDYQSVPHACAFRIMQRPEQGQRLNFNWWVWSHYPEFDWGPMLEANRRDFGTGGMGTPYGDEARYYLMANGERDYDQMFCRMSFQDEGWLGPRPTATDVIAYGEEPQMLLSIGPFDLPAGESLPLTFAVIAGEDFRRSPTDFHEFMEVSYSPDLFYATLDFDDLVENAVTAYWVYDNPGYDTDDDGYSGPYWEIVDTLPNGEIVFDRYYYAGDGVPDFRAATPPPAPVIRFFTSHETVKLKWNGLASETAVDPFTGIQDFEGYRVYMGRLNTVNALGLVTSHDFYN